MTVFDKYADVHTHRLDAGPDAIINLPWGAPVPKSGSYSVGIHPWDAASATDADIAELRRLAALPQVVAIGETGLDALRGPSLAEQEQVFRKHAAVAEEAGKPLIIHAVRTLQRLIELRRELRPAQPWLIHGYRGKPQMAQQLVREGFHLSIGSRFNPGLPGLIPPDRLHHETD